MKKGAKLSKWRYDIQHNNTQQNDIWFINN